MIVIIVTVTENDYVTTYYGALDFGPLHKLSLLRMPLSVIQRIRHLDPSAQ